MYTEEDRWTTTVRPDGTLEILRQTVVTKDGTEIGRQNWRVALAPGSALDGYPPVVTAVADAVWTPEVIAAYAEAHPEPTP